MVISIYAYEDCGNVLGRIVIDNVLKDMAIDMAGEIDNEILRCLEVIDEN